MARIVRTLAFMSRPTILCPVDFSNASQARAHRRAIAEHFGAKLTLLTVPTGC